MRLNTCRYINQESAQFADTHIFSLIITQPTNALIVCHLFLNNFLKHFHCSYMFRYVYVLHLYGQTIRQLCTAPVWADNQTNVYVLHLYGQTIRQLCTASVWADNQTTVYCKTFPCPGLPYPKCVQQFTFACNRQDSMSMLHPHSKHYYVAQNNRPGIYTQLNKNDTSDKPLDAIPLHTATQHCCGNKQEMPQSPSNHTI